MSVSNAMNRFFDSSRFAVVGASKDPSKFGNKVLKWYTTRGLPATPIHPKETEIEGLTAVPNVSQLLAQLKAEGQISTPDQLALSVVTPPKVSLAVVKQGLTELGLGAIWLQPGAEDADLVAWARSQPQDIQDRIVYGGPCILVSGDQLAKAKGKL